MTPSLAPCREVYLGTLDSPLVGLPARPLPLSPDTQSTQPETMSDDRDTDIYMAKLAEQAERYDEMVEHMKNVAQQPKENCGLRRP